MWASAQTIAGPRSKLIPLVKAKCSSAAGDGNCAFPSHCGTESHDIPQIITTTQGYAHEPRKKMTRAGFLPVPHSNHPEPKLIFPTL